MHKSLAPISPIQSGWTPLVEPEEQLNRELGELQCCCLCRFSSSRTGWTGRPESLRSSLRGRWRSSGWTGPSWPAPWPPWSWSPVDQLTSASNLPKILFRCLAIAVVTTSFSGCWKSCSKVQVQSSHFEWISISSLSSAVKMWSMVLM